MNETVPLINQITFFFTYTIFRMFLFPYLAYSQFLMTLYTWESLDTFRRGCQLATFIFFTLILLLNYYWYMLILKGLKKLIDVNVFGKEVTPKKGKKVE